MKKEELLFLIKSGFSIEEIMNLSEQPTGAPQPTEQSTGAPQPTGQPTQPTGQPTQPTEPTGQPQPTGQSQPTIDERITEMQREIAELREQAHRQNRITAVIENPKTAKTFEENVEDLLMEVNK